MQRSDGSDSRDGVFLINQKKSMQDTEVHLIYKIEFQILVIQTGSSLS